MHPLCRDGHIDEVTILKQNKKFKVETKGSFQYKKLEILVLVLTNVVCVYYIEYISSKGIKWFLVHLQVNACYDVNKKLS
jgi:hypothetical protein